MRKFGFAVAVTALVISVIALAESTNKPIGVIITSSGERLEIHGSQQSESNYWTTSVLDRFWKDQEVRNQSARKALAKRQEAWEQHRQEEERKALEQTEQAALEQLPAIKGSGLRQLLQTALHQATLDRGMEDLDGNDYLFEFPAAAKLPNMDKHATQGFEVDKDGKPVLVHLYRADEVAAIPSLRKSWFEATCKIGLKKENKRLYVFVFPKETLEQAGLL
jgi:hypothetical protein